MLPYVTSSRRSRPFPYSVGSNKGVGYGFLEETHSWRTGRKARNSDFGNHVVQPPPNITGKNLGDTIRARSDYITQIGENLTDQNTEPYVQNVRFLTHDTGHSYWNVKHFHRGTGSRTVSHVGRPEWDYTHSGQAFLSPTAVVPPGVSPKSMNFSSTGFSRALGPDSATLSVDVRSLFESARPDDSIAGWGETIAELLSGNIPKVVTKFGKKLASGQLLYQSKKQTGIDLGDDYLNNVFGWTPIIRDLMATIEHLLQVHDFLYSASYTRKRSTRERKTVSYLDTVPLFGCAGIASDSTMVMSAADRGGINISRFGKETQHYDTRLNARFTRARPSAKANAYVDRALDILQTFGVVYPALAWDLIPFSWLVDWSMHLGQGINNYSTYSSNGGSFKTDYAYSTTRSTSVITAPAGSSYDKRFDYSWSSASRWTAIRQTTISTFRRPATPFGFSVSLQSLSSTQYAILVALGLARMR